MYLFFVFRFGTLKKVINEISVRKLFFSYRIVHKSMIASILKTFILRHTYLQVESIVTIGRNETEGKPNTSKIETLHAAG